MDVGGAAKRIVMAAFMLHGVCFGEEAGARNLVFPCKVAAAGDERFLLCAAGAAAVVSGSNRFSLAVLQRVDANRIVMSAWMCIGGAAKRIVKAA